MILVVSALLGISAGFTRSLASIVWVALAVGASFMIAALTGPTSYFHLVEAVAGYNVGLMACVAGMFGWLKIKPLLRRVQI